MLSTSLAWHRKVDPAKALLPLCAFPATYAADPSIHGAVTVRGTQLTVLLVAAIPIELYLLAV